MDSLNGKLMITYSNELSVIVERPTEEQVLRWTKTIAERQEATERKLNAIRKAKANPCKNIKINKSLIK